MNDGACPEYVYRNKNIHFQFMDRVWLSIYVKSRKGKATNVQKCTASLICTIEQIKKGTYICEGHIHNEWSQPHIYSHVFSPDLKLKHMY